VNENFQLSSLLTCSVDHLRYKNQTILAMENDMYKLPEPADFQANGDLTFENEKAMPAEVDSLNAFSEVIQDYFHNPDMFDPLRTKSRSTIYIFISSTIITWFSKATCTGTLRPVKMQGS
jgi:hypothetical protein